MDHDVKQVSKDHYRFARYSHVGRWASYYYQLREVLGLEPSSVLEVGVGDRVFESYIRSNTHITYTSVDVDKELHPDVVGSVLALPFGDSQFDVSCAFEVLEHIPFEKFELALGELARVSKKHVVISLPHFGPPVQWEIKIPFLPRLRFSWKVPYPRTHVFNGEHYWEIGKKGYSPRVVREVFARNFVITKEFVPFENQYHHFFVLRKKT